MSAPGVDIGSSIFIMVPSTDIVFSAWISAPNLRIGSKLGYRVECEGGGLEYDGDGGFDDQGDVGQLGYLVSCKNSR